MPHDHRIYGRGHAERVQATIDSIAAHPATFRLVADLSCGNATIARSVVDNPILGDFAPGYPIQGRIEETIRLVPPVDLFVLSETLEHLHDPDYVLRRVADKTGHLALSTPIECWDDTNAEHLWAWSRADVEAMFWEAGFAPDSFTMVDSRTYGEPYCYGIWMCQRIGSGVL